MNTQAAIASDVRIGTDKGVLRLQFSTKISQAYYGKRQFYKSLGRSDSPINREWANRIVLRIQQDLDHPDNLFDPSLEKYLGHKVIALPTAIHNPKLSETWNEYCDWKLATGQLQQTTYQSRYRRTFQNQLKPYLDQEITKDLINQLANELMLADNYKPNLKKLFNTLIEMGERATRQGNLSNNFFLDLKDINIRVDKKSHQLQQEEDFRAFSIKERDIIVETFYKSNREIEVQIAPLIEFLFLTGCRLGEAFAFKWKDVKSDWIVFDESYSTECKLTKTTKTDTIRIFRTTGYTKLLALLDTVREQRISLTPNDCIFLKKNNKPYTRLDLSALWLGADKSKRGINYYYDGVVTRLVKSGLVAQYLKPSATRHTFITLQAQNGVDLKLLADSCGNSIDVIYNHYLGQNRDSKLLNL